MNPKNRAILKTDTDNTPPEIPRVKQAQACPACSGRGEVDDNDPYRDRDSRVACPNCAGTGWISGALLVFAILLLSLCNAHAATVTGTIRNRQGGVTATNIYFKAVQRPLFDATPSVLPGWTLSTNSAANGTFSTPLVAGDYIVSVGGENRDSFIISVPTNNSTYDIQLLVTNLATYRYTGGQNFTNFLASLNGATSANQSLATDESGSDFAVTTAGTIHTFSLPTASASKTGKLTSADWSDFFSRVTQAQLTAESNALVTFSMAVSNAVYTAETTRNAAVSNAAVAFTLAASNTLYRTGANLTTTDATKFGLFASLSGNNLRFYGLEQGSNTVLYFNGSNIVINAVATTGGGTGGGGSGGTFDSTGGTFDSITNSFDSTL